MIAGISSGYESEYEFEVFLEKTEIENLEKQTLEGLMINLTEPKKQNPLQISVNDKKTAKTTFRKYKKVRLSDTVIEGFEADKYQIFISDYYYAKLKDTGSISGRIGLHKIDVIEETLAEPGGIYYEDFGKRSKIPKETKQKYDIDYCCESHASTSSSAILLNLS